MHRRRRRPRSAPPDLFAPRPQRPTWDQLPPTVRHSVVTLLAELLRGVRDGVAFNQHFEGDGGIVFQHACALC